MKVENWPIDQVKPYDNNPRNNDGAVDATANSIKKFGWQQPIVVDKDGVIIVGHTRFKAAKKLKLDKVPVVVADALSDEQVKAYRLADNKTGELADWDFSMLDDELADITDIDMSDFGFEDEEEKSSLEKIQDNPLDSHLNDTFIEPPFSILDATSARWQQRKKKWLAMGIKSEVGRDDHLVYSSSLDLKGLKGTSIFDPVLCELCYRWFMPDRENGNNIFDPFSGGSVRGVVASKLGNLYTGIDLRDEQIEANRINAKELGLDLIPNWHADDSSNMDKYVEDGTQDLVFTCPPYGDLEVYSDDPRDISNMDSDDFDKQYFNIIKKSVAKLKNNRFAIVVIQDIRDKNGFYRDLTGLTTRAMESSGAR